MILKSHSRILHRLPTLQRYLSTQKERVCIVGSGNWGSAISKIVGANVQSQPELFEPIVHQWVHPEDYESRPLTDWINHSHENPRYLPGIQLPQNLQATDSLEQATQHATVLILVLPHQFLPTLLPHLPSPARAISLIKGFDIHPLELCSDRLARQMVGTRLAVLSGPNIAQEVALGRLSETTIGCDRSDAAFYRALFETDRFRVRTVEDRVGVEICGALKNIVAIGAGLSDGLGYGANTKSVIMRLGLLEMKKFGQMFFDSVQDATFFESCGMADLITTCLAGRNRKVAEAFAVTRKPIEQLEKEMLNGQKLQGTLTAKEVHEFLSSHQLTHEFPLFKTVYRIVYENAPLESLIKTIH